MRYRISTDEILSNLNLGTDYDISKAGHFIEVEEENIQRAVAEIISNFTATLMNAIESVPTREEAYPFDCVKPRIEEDGFGFHYFICPVCKQKNFKSDWNNSEDVRPRCLHCEKVIWMRKG